tara:strand:+ start:2070 stop:7526 length:5457 start_codon:yes stop_codon:yes gene_type:complete
MARSRTSKEIDEEKVLEKRDKLADQLFETELNKQIELGNTFTQEESKALYQSSLEQASAIWGTPLTTDFGDVKERSQENNLMDFAEAAPAFNLPPAADPMSTFEALQTASRTQTFAPESAPKGYTQERPKIDFDKIMERIQTSEGLDDESAFYLKAGYKEAYKAYKAENPDSPDNLILSQIADEIEGLAYNNEYSPENIAQQQTSPTEVTSAMSYGGAKLPNYTLIQSAYLKGQAEARTNKYVGDKRRSIQKRGGTYVKITSADGKQRVAIPKAVADYIRGDGSGSGGLGATIYSPEVDKIVREGNPSSPYTEQENSKQNARAIARVEFYETEEGAGTDAWFIDYEKKKEVLADPEKFYSDGILTKTTGFGGIQETTAGKNLRLALGGLNLVAGATTAATLYAGDVVFDTDTYDVWKEGKAEMAPLFADHPIIANYALNQGFTGEAMLMSQLGFAPKGQEWALELTGLALDLADPTPAVATGILKGANAGRKLVKAQKAMYGTGKGGFASAFADVAKAEILTDFNVLTFANKRLGKAGVEIPYGSVARIYTDDIAEGLETRRGLRAGEDVMTNDSYTYAVVKQMDGGKTLPEALDAVDEITAKAIGGGDVAKGNKLLKEFDDTTRYLDELAQNGQAAAGRLAAQEKLAIVNSDVVDDIYKFHLDSNNGNVMAARNDATKTIQQSYGSKILFAAEPKMVDLTNVIAITRNTLGHTKDMDELFALEKATPVGKSLQDAIMGAKVSSVRPASVLREAQAPTMGTAGRQAIETATEPVYVLTRQGANDLFAEIQQSNLPKLVKDEAEQFLFTGGQPTLPFSTAKRIKEANLDFVAQTSGNFRTLEEFSTLRNTDGSLTVQAEQVLEAKGTRLRATIPVPEFVSKSAGFVKRQLGRFSPNIQRNLDFEVLSSSNDLAQRRAFRDIQQNSSGLDNKLRRDFRALTGGDTAVLERYLTPAQVTAVGGRKLTTGEAMGVLIVGETQDALGKIMQRQNVGAAIDWSSGRMFFKTEAEVNFANSLFGINLLYRTDVFNAAGKGLYDNLVKQFVRDVIDDPLAFQTKFTQLNADIMTDVVKNENLAGGISMSQVENAFTTLGGSRALQNQIGMYYHTGGKRAIDKALDQLIVDDAAAGALQGLNLDVVKSAAKTLQDPTKTRLDAYDAITERLVLGTEKADIVAELTRLETEYNALRTRFPDIDMGGGATIPDPRAPVRDMRLKQEDILKTKAVLTELDRTIIDSIYNNVDVYRKVNQHINAAELVLQRNGLNSPKFGAADAQKQLNDLFEGDPQLQELIYGVKQYEQIKKLVGGERLSNLTQNLDRALRPKTATAQGIEIARTIYDLFQGSRYNVLLTARPRFHIVNLATAPDIIYSQTGILPTFQDTAIGAVIANADLPLASQAIGPYKGSDSVAVTTPSGIQYTFRQLKEALDATGMRSQYEVSTSLLNDKDLMALLKTADPTSNALLTQYRTTMSLMKELAYREDQMYRAGVAVTALKEGRSLEEAMDLAKKSLYDYGDLTQAEKTRLAQFILFYNFQRQNYVGFMKAFASVASGDFKPINRYLQTLKFQRGINMVYKDNTGMESPLALTMPSYTKNRSIIDKYQKKVGPDKFKNIYITTPPLPSVDATLMFTKLVYPVIGGPIRDAVKPELKQAMGIKPKFSGKSQISNEYINLLGLYMDPEGVFNLLESVYGKGNVVPAAESFNNPDVSSVGFNYYVDNDTMDTYQKFIGGLVSTTGVETPIKDLSSWFTMREGTKNSELDFTDTMLYNLGLISTAQYATPEQLHKDNVKTKFFEYDRALKAEKKEERIMEDERGGRERLRRR